MISGSKDGDVLGILVHTASWLPPRDYTCSHPRRPRKRTVPLTTGPPQLPAQGVPGLLFIAALFTIAKTWKHPRCPSKDGWIKKLSYIYAMEYYSAIKRNERDSVELRWMSLELVIQSKISQKEKNKYHILTCVYIYIYIYGI